MNFKFPSDCEKAMADRDHGDKPEGISVPTGMRWQMLETAGHIDEVYHKEKGVLTISDPSGICSITT